MTFKGYSVRGTSGWIEGRTGGGTGIGPRPPMMVQRPVAPPRPPSAPVPMPPAPGPRPPGAESTPRPGRAAGAAGTAAPRPWSEVLYEFALGEMTQYERLAGIGFRYAEHLVGVVGTLSHGHFGHHGAHHPQPPVTPPAPPPPVVLSEYVRERTGTTFQVFHPVTNPGSERVGFHVTLSELIHATSGQGRAAESRVLAGDHTVEPGGRNVVEIQVSLRGVEPGLYTLLVESNLAGTICRRRVEVEVVAPVHTEGPAPARYPAPGDPTQGDPTQGDPSAP
ncbi:MAG: hypothetical protein HY909_18540 [Deltaproteobacteria bacterium]|nr:hypothetical protein [Deltaproteobacteria bacterium]